MQKNLDDFNVMDKMTQDTSSPNPGSHPSKMSIKNSEHLRLAREADRSLSISLGIHDI